MTNSMSGCICDVLSGMTMLRSGHCCRERKSPVLLWWGRVLVALSSLHYQYRDALIEYEPPAREAADGLQTSSFGCLIS